MFAQIKAFAEELPVVAERYQKRERARSAVKRALHSFAFNRLPTLNDY